MSKKKTSQPRVEPGLGQWQHASGQQQDDALRTPARHRSETPNKPKDGWRRGFWLLLLFALIATAAYWWVPRWQAGMGEGSVRQSLLNRAQQAEQAEQWRGDDGAVALYRAMLALDPDDHEARQAIHRLGQSFIQRAETLALRGDATAMNNMLDLARACGVGQTDVDAVLAQQHHELTTAEQLPQWVDAARKAEQEDRWDGDNGARVLWQKVAQTAPDNALAKAGLQRVLDHDAAEVALMLDMGNLEDARQRMQYMAAINPSDWRLADFRTALTHKESQSKQAQQFHQLASELRQPSLQASDTLKHWKALAALPLPPSLSEQKDALTEATFERARTQFMQHLQEAQWNDAKAWLEVLAAVRPNAPELATWEKQWRMRQQASREVPVVQSEDSLPASPTSAETPESPVMFEDDASVSDAQVGRWLQQARRAQQRGDWVEPPGESAYDLYRRAQSARPNQPQIRADLDAFIQYVPRQTSTWIREGALRKAAHGLDQWEAMTPLDPALADIRRMLAQACAGRADELLGAHRIQAARGMLHMARKYDAQQRDLPRLQARLDALEAARWPSP